ncbi:RNA-directed DNA polymerase, eukaryota [Tanacetum coccineum]
MVRSVTIVPSADRWNWNLESTGIFSVASARRRIDEICLPNIGEETRWVKCVPIKINVLAWKIKTDALPTRFNISRRGIDIQDMSCPICDNAIESTDHLFFRCGLVRDIANKVLSWWNLDHANLNSYAEWKSWLVSIRMDSKLKKMFEGVWYSIWWYVWIHWHTRGIFKDIFPRLYPLESSKDVTVSSKIGDTSLVRSFRRIPRGGIEQNQFDSLVELVRSVTIVPSADRWNWNLESTGIFSVASARRRIDEICLPNIGEETRWVKCVPIKINVLAWKIKTDALPTRFNISRRGIDIQDMSCPICDNAIESTDHLFFRCGLVRDIANKVLSWWNLDHANLNSYAEWKSWLVSIRMDSKLKKMFEGVWYSIWWYVWIYRNKLLFDERKPSKSMLIDNVIASSFYWCKYRSKASFGWNEWLKNPYIIVL